MAVKSADRVVFLLEIFAREKRPLRFSELLSRSEIPKSSLSALLKTLQDSDYLFFNPETQAFYPTNQWRILFDQIFQGDPLKDFPESILEYLSAETGETALLARLAPGSVCYVKVREPDRVVRFSAKPGDTRPVYSTSSGRAILSSFSKSALEAYCSGLAFERYTGLTVASEAELIRKVRHEREQGWHENLGENEDDTASASVYCRFNGVSVALVVGSPKNRYLEKRERIIAALRHVVSEGEIKPEFLPDQAG